MKISVLKEKLPGEHRVALYPDIAKKISDLGIKICVEKDAGAGSDIEDREFTACGAKISAIPLEIIADADVIFKVQPSSTHLTDALNEFNLMQEGSVLIGLMSPYENKALIEHLAKKRISVFAMEMVPRITRAQNMDVLSSQSNLAGYKAVIEAANLFNKAFPMLMTAAGTITPARVLILGAGVAGLQAIATAKRLGAVVSAFDVRAAAKEQVESLGAKFIEVKTAENENLETAGGYAKETSETYKKKQQELLQEALAKSDIVISTALIPGKKAPILITEDMVNLMKPGSIIIDLAAIQGGNCALTKKDEINIHKGVKIVGYTNMVARIAHDASKLYARNLFNFFSLLYDQQEKRLNINLEDEIIRSTLITHDGEIVNKLIKEAYYG